MDAAVMRSLRLVVASITLVSTGCASNEALGAKDGGGLDGGDNGDAAVDAARPLRCEAFLERDGGTLATDADGGTDGDAGATSDAGEPAWHEGTGCLSIADDCTVHEGRVGDHVCVEVGYRGADPFTLWYVDTIHGECAAFVEKAFVPTPADSEECDMVYCESLDCAIVPFYCTYDVFHLYELVSPGECLLEIRTEPALASREFDILFRVLEP
jgi:hypothetical protein